MPRGCSCTGAANAYCPRCTAILARQLGIVVPAQGGRPSRAQGRPQAVLPPGAARGTQLPLRLTARKHHGHWRVHQREVKYQRQYIYERLRTLWDDGPLLGLPLRITLTRIAPRPLDDDNLALACSAVRDGVSDWLVGQYAKGEDRQPGLEWAYRQQAVAPRFYAVEIRVERPKQRSH